MSDEPAPFDSGDGDEPIAEEPKGPSKLERAAGVAQKVLRHKELLIAAMEMIRAKGALSEEEEVKIVSAYETGTAAARSALGALVERLQKASFGKVVIALSQELQPEDLSAEGLRSRARQGIAAVKDEFMAEARPYIEQARNRLKELKALEEPTLRRLEGIGADLKDASRVVAEGLKGAGREAANELVKRGKRMWMSAETEELEREFFDWVLRAIPRAEKTLVRFLIGFGLLLFMSGLLLAAHEIGVLEQLAMFIAIVLLVALGLSMINWGIKISQAFKSGRGQIETLAQMSPSERRVFLAQRWTERAQKEGAITSDEARTVIEETIRALPREDVPGTTRAATAAATSAKSPNSP